MVPLALRLGAVGAESGGLAWSQCWVPLGAQLGTDANSDGPLFNAPTSAVVCWDPTGAAQSMQAHMFRFCRQATHMLWHATWETYQCAMQLAGSCRQLIIVFAAQGISWQ